MDIICNGNRTSNKVNNTTSNKVNKEGLHMNPRGLSQLAIDSVRRIKKFATT